MPFYHRSSIIACSMLIYFSILDDQLVPANPYLCPADVTLPKIGVETSQTEFLHLVISCSLVTFQLADLRRSKTLSHALPPIHQLPIIYFDYLGATFLSKNPVLYSRVKHVVVDFHFVHHHVDTKRARVVHVYGADQIADTLTKALLKPGFENNLSKLGLVTHCLT
ncbi:hypothetical protein KY290_009221 [Solanum tuberosum]|uniref:Uncharacterized protein n=1 Tax=Solanum tuberosum TaxID=4113 RepID=A0ABQ7WCT7_SOLTU|nr:hypothetical protein KY290_009221 [Solanum tuberosum]